MKELIARIAEKHDLDPALVYGVCMKESSLDPLAMRYEPNYRWLITNIDGLKPANCSRDTEMIMQKISWGLMQVMGAVLREYKFAGWLNQISFIPELQLKYGCIHLKKKLARWGTVHGIAAYNSGTPRFKEGQLVNQEYVDKVMKFSGQYGS